MARVNFRTHLSPFSTPLHHTLSHRSPQPLGYPLRSFCAVLSIPMSTNSVLWSCSNCGAKLRKPRPIHEACGGEVHYECKASGLHGKHESYRKHLLHCEHCSPEAKDSILESREIDKENRMEVVEDKEEGQSSFTPVNACDLTFPTQHVFHPPSFPCVCFVQSPLHRHGVTGSTATRLCGR
jgi:hypothetical protein